MELVLSKFLSSSRLVI